MNLANYTVNKKLIAPESVKLGDMQNFIDGINERIEEERKPKRRAFRENKGK